MKSFSGKRAHVVITIPFLARGELAEEGRPLPVGRFVTGGEAGLAPISRGGAG